MGRDLDEVVDIRSGLAYLLAKWKLIALAVLAGAVIGGLFGNMKSSQTQTEAVSGYEDSISRARAACSEQGALYAEQLSAQYKAYNSALSEWGVYLNNSALQKMDPYDYVKKDLQYSVVTDNGNMIDAFSGTLLGQKECEEIGAILGEDPLTASLGELVVVGGTGRTGGTKDENEEVDVRTEITNNMGEIHREIMTVSIIAGNESQADAIEAVVDSAVEAKCSKLQAGEVQVKIEKTDALTTRNDSKWLLNRKQAALDKLVSFQINYSLFIKNTTDILQGSQKSYYEMLITLDPEKAVQTSEVKSGSSKGTVRSALIGGAAGLILAVICAYLMFVFSNKIQTGEELYNNYRLSLLQRFRTGEIKKWDVIRNCGLSALGMDRAAEISEAGAAPLYAELERKTAQLDKKQVYVTCDCSDEDICSRVKELAGLLTDKNITVLAGNPLESDEDYRALLDSDLVVMAEVLNRSSRKAFKDLLEACRRNELPVLGCITVLDVVNY